VKSGLAKSNNEARESVKSGAIFVNEKKVEDFNFEVAKNFINDKVLLLRKGKKNFRIVTV
jgi:tyrosyl-tRNA synthetase